jgi:MoaA/NifB/PqqE/SkfB family radical SAM enzyme
MAKKMGGVMNKQMYSPVLRQILYNVNSAIPNSTKSVIKWLSYNNLFRPRSIKISTVDLCNNKCIICGYKKMRDKKGIMRAETFAEVVNKYADSGGGSVTLTPIVGEIFLNKHLYDYIKILRKHKNIGKIGFHTNASVINQFKEQQLKYIFDNVQNITISVYGLDPDEYFHMTGNHNYDSMILGIKKIIELSPSHVTILFRLLKQRNTEDTIKWTNISLLQGIKRKCTIDIGSFMLKDYAIWPNMGKSPDLLPFDASYCNVKYNLTQCLVPIYGYGIYPNGNVSICPCCNLEDVQELSLGNISEGSLLDFYNNEKSLRFWNWEQYGIPEICKCCSFHIPIINIEQLFHNDWTIDGSGRGEYSIPRIKSYLLNFRFIKNLNEMKKKLRDVSKGIGGKPKAPIKTSVE